MKFRKKPVVIEAFLWTGDEHQVEDPEWACDAIRDGRIRFENSGTPEVALAIDTLEGTHRANRGDWIIRGVNGEMYPCKPDIFAATYEAVEVDGVNVAACEAPAVGLSFGEALRHLHNGCKLQRMGWNGSGQWIVLMPPLRLPPFNAQAPGPKVNDRTAKHIGPDTPLDSQPYFALWTAQGKWQPGWNPSTSDALAYDWQIVQ